MENLISYIVEENEEMLLEKEYLAIYLSIFVKYYSLNFPYILYLRIYLHICTHIFIS